MTKQIDPIKNAEVLINGKKADYERLLPKHISAEKFCQTAINFLRDKADILALPIPSLLAATEKAARDGLLIDGKEAYLKKQYLKSAGGSVVAYEAMYRGLLKLVRNTGEVLTVSSHVVFEGEDFSFSIENGVEKLYHKPNVFGAKAGAKILGAYACATLKDGSAQIIVMSEEEIMKRKAVNESSDHASSPWQKWPVEQRQKTVLKKLTSALSTSSEKVQKVYEEIEEQDRSDGAPEPVIETAQPELKPVTAETFDPQTGEVLDQPSEPKPAAKKLSLKEQGEQIAVNQGSEGLVSWFKTLSKPEKEQAKKIASDLNKLTLEFDKAQEAKVQAQASEPKPAAKKQTKIHEIVKNKSAPLYDEVPAHYQAEAGDVI